MADIGAITGIAEVIRNLKLREAQLAAGISRGLRRAGLKLQRESQLRVPVNFGNLKNSAFTRKEGEGWSTKVNVGYTAHYAIYVHELVQMKLKGQKRPSPNKGRFWDPQGRGQAKFLEEPARTLAAQLRKIIQEEGKI